MAAPTKGKNDKPKGKGDGQDGKRDGLNMGRLAAQYGFAEETINADPDLRELFQWAVKQGPGLPFEAFQARLKRTGWWQTSANSWRQAFLLEYGGDETWETDYLNPTKRSVMQRANELGVSLSDDQAARIARLSIYNNWAKNNPGRLDEVLVEGTGKGFKGVTGQDSLRMQALDTYNAIKDFAEQNGLSYGPREIRKYAMGVLNPNDDITLDSIRQEMVVDAQTQWPAFADRIGRQVGEGQFLTLRDVAAPYLKRIADGLELASMDELKLNDSLVSQVLANTDDKGNSVLPPLWKVDEMVRNDKRWMDTEQANQEWSDLADNLADQFGVAG